MKTPTDKLCSPTEAQKAYWASMIDGEGSITITRGGYTNKYKGKRLKTYHYTIIRIQINNTNKSLVEHACRELGTHTNRGPGYPNNGGTSRPIWKANVESFKARHILRLLLPYLRLKRRQAALALMIEPAAPGQVPSRDEKIFRHVAWAVNRYMNDHGAEYDIPWKATDEKVAGI